MRKFFAIVSVLAMLAVLGACGGGSDEPIEGASTPARSGSPAPTDPDAIEDDDEWVDPDEEVDPYDDETDEEWVDPDDETVDPDDETVDPDDETVDPDQQAVSTTTVVVPADDFDVTTLLGVGEFSDLGDWAVRHFGCRSKSGAVGTLLCLRSGLILETTLSVQGTIVEVVMIKNATADWEGAPSGSFSTYTGTIPAGLTWEMSAGEVVPMLDAAFGEPVNRYLTDDGKWIVRNEYAVTGERFGGMGVEFDPATWLLSRVSLSLKPPMRDEWP